MVELGPGSVFNGRFVIQQRIQSGGTRLVYRASDQQSHRLVALKLLRRDAPGPERDRLLREASRLATLRHPGIVAYVAHGISEQGHPYLAMEWLPGHDLGQLLRQQTLPVAQVLALLRAVAEALAVAHQAGLLHRDLKPSNLFLRDGQLAGVTIIDFGLTGRAVGEAPVTLSGGVVGTAEYMAPEQARGDQELGPSVDIFALGCVAYECLTGQPPFVGAHPAVVLARILFEEVPPLRRRHPELPAAVDKLVAAMLAKDPRARIADAVALRTALAALGELDEPTPSALPAPLHRFAMAGGELLLVSVVIVQPDGAALRRDAPLTEWQRDQTAALREEFAQVGIWLKSLADGSLIATVSSPGGASEQAIKAAGCALVIKERLPDSLVALATGRGVVKDHTVFGEVLERLGELLTTARQTPQLGSDAVFIDQTSSHLLEKRFAITLDPGGARLLRRLSPMVEETWQLLGVATQCVGRERELDLLAAAFAGCTADESAAVVVVRGPPGIGKSRVRHEFLRRLKQTSPEVLVLTGQGDPMTAGAAYGVLAQALRRLFGISQGQEPQVRQAKIRARVQTCIAPAEVSRVAAFLGEICGTEFPDSLLLRVAQQDRYVMGDQVAQAFIDFLKGVCEQQATLLVLEDLHWGDALTIKLVDSALRALRDCRFMVLAVCRPELLERFPKLWAERGKQDLRLVGLPSWACEQLFDRVLGQESGQESGQLPGQLRKLPFSPQTKGLLIEKAAGMALLLEELMRAVAEGKSEAMPETVLAVLSTRLLRIDPMARRVLRAASIFGETFWAGGVQALLGQDAPGEPLAGWLQLLCQSEIIERRPDSRFPREVEYGFRHSLLREAAYYMLPDADRRIGHYLAGGYLESQGEHDPAILAEHFHHSGDPLRTIELYARAAEKACAGNDLEGALRHAEQGLRCGAQGQVRGRLLSIQTVALLWRCELQKAHQIGRESLALLTPGTQPFCQAIQCVAVVATALGFKDQVSELALNFVHSQAAPDSLAAYVEAACQLACMMELIGDRTMTKLFLARAQQVCLPLVPTHPHVRAHLSYARGRYASSLLPAPFTAIGHLQSAFADFQLSGDRRAIAFTASDLGLALARVGATTQALGILRDGVRLAQLIDEPSAISWVQLPLALVLAESGDAAAHKEARQLVDELLRTVGEDTYYGGIALCSLAAVHSAAGEHSQATAVARRALQTLRPTPSSAPLGFIALTRALLAAGRVDESTELASEGVQLVESLGGGGGSEVALRGVLVAALERQGDAQRTAHAQAELTHQLAIRAQEIPESSLRASFLARFHNPDRQPLF